MEKAPRLNWQKLTLKLRNPFRVSYGVSDTRTAFWIRLVNDEGWGEGTIPPYYGVDESAMAACWDAAAHTDRPFPDDPAEIPAWVGEDGPAPARSALDLALYDRIGRQRGLPLYALLGLPKPEPTPTSFTLSMDTPEEMARMALEIRDYPIIKIKLGSAGDEARLDAIRGARPDARLRIDANAGWSRDEAVKWMRMVAKYGVEMVEQPLAKEDFEGMGLLQKETEIPIVADESVRSLDDVERLAAVGVKGINLKLMKVGGLSPAVAILRKARVYGMRVMLGCMIETSLGTSAMAHLMGQADWIDLDAPILISNDPFRGMSIDRFANVSISDAPGIGVTLENREIL